MICSFPCFFNPEAVCVLNNSLCGRSGTPQVKELSFLLLEKNKAAINLIHDRFVTFI